jgi:hypothetical protein
MATPPVPSGPGLYSTPLTDAVNVRALGAVGNGTTDDTAAWTQAIAAAGPGGLIYAPPGRYAVSAPLAPQSGQTWILPAGAVFVPRTDTPVIHAFGVLHWRVLGSLRVEDPAGLTQTQPAVVFDGQCRWCVVDSLETAQVAVGVSLRDINESHFGRIHVVGGRRNGIVIEDGAAGQCNVHDNSFPNVFVGGPGPTAPSETLVSGYGILFTAQHLGTVGGNRWGQVTALAWPRAGVQVQAAGMIEQWWDTLIADSCGIDGVHFYGGTAKFFVGTLWVSTNGSHGLYCNGTPQNPVEHMEIGQVYAHGNGGAGIFCDSDVRYMTLGSVILHGNGDGLRFHNRTHHLAIGRLLAHGQTGVDVTDLDDTSSTAVVISVLDAARVRLAATLASGGTVVTTRVA